MDNKIPSFWQYKKQLKDYTTVKKKILRNDKSLIIILFEHWENGLANRHFIFLVQVKNYIICGDEKKSVDQKKKHFYQYFIL